MSTEDLIAGLRSNRGRMPTKGSEMMRKKKKKEEREMMKGARFE